MTSLILFLSLLAPTLSQPTARVAILTPQGLSWAALGPGVTLTKDATNGWLLNASAPTIAHVRITLADAGTAGGNILVLFRNGIALTEGVDYERPAGGGIRLTAQGMEPGDIWSALVQR